MERRGHHRLAVSERERGELTKDNVVRDAERVEGTDRADPRDDGPAALPQAGQHVVHRTRERHLSGIDRVGATALARRVVHPHVVDVGDQDRQSRDELPAVDRPGGEEPAADDVGKLECAGSDVTGVHDPVITEERRVRVRRAKDRPVARKRLHGRLLFDGVPEALLEDRPDILREVAVERPMRAKIRRCCHRGAESTTNVRVDDATRGRALSLALALPWVTFSAMTDIAQASMGSLGLVERVAALHRVELFAGIPGRVLAAVAEGGRREALLDRRGADGGGRRRGAPLRDRRRPRQECIAATGRSSSSVRAPRWASWLCWCLLRAPRQSPPLEPTLVLRVDQAVLDELLVDWPELAHGVIAELVSRLRATTEFADQAS